MKKLIGFVDVYLTAGVGIGLIWNYADLGHIPTKALIIFGVLTIISLYNLYSKKMEKSNELQKSN